MKDFYICSHCGNVAGKIIDSGVDMICCGEKMEKLIPKSADNTNEKHVPVIEVKDNDVKVTVGSTPHPMKDEHYIEFIILETDQGCQIKMLKPNDKPIATFKLNDCEKVVNAYEYCNVHGFWIAEL